MLRFYVMGSSSWVLKMLRCVLFMLYLSFSACSNHPIRRTKYGRIRGTMETGYDGKKVEQFLGIPYAQPPVGNLRFERPVPPRSWEDEIRSAVSLSPACPQPVWGVSYIEYHVKGFNRTSEDCLYLNVYTPKSNHHSRNLRPVLVFVHGGSYYSGMGAILDGSALAAKGIVVVSVNYRLGALGFLTSGNRDLPGNYGMLDLVAALHWIQDNIAYFNGNPSYVTIDGHSAGGCAAGLLMMSPLAKGLFRRVIIQSGSPLGHWSVTRFPRGPSIHFKVFASAFDCMSDDFKKTKECLQAVPTDKMHHFIAKKYDVVTSPSLTPQFRPVVDGYFMPNTPEELVQTGDFEVESVMTGATKDEGLIAAIPLIKRFSGESVGRAKLLTLMYCFRGDLPEVPGIVDVLLEQYTQWPNIVSDQVILNSFSEIIGDYYITAPTHKIAGLLSRRNTTVYLYNYEYKSQVAPWNGVVHGAEIFYLSGCPFTGKCNHFRYEASDKDMTEMLLELWSNFAINGLPALVHKSEFYMDRYSRGRPVFTRIAADEHQQPVISLQYNLKPTKLKFWNVDVPRMYDRKSNQVIIDETRIDVVPQSYVVDVPNSWALIATCIGLSVLTILFSVAYCKSRRRIKLLLQQSNVPISSRML